MADDHELLVAGEPTEPGTGWVVGWADRDGRAALLRRGTTRELVAIDGAAGEWLVTIRGRPIPVTVRSHRDRLLAAAVLEIERSGGPAEVRASLPGLVIRVMVALGDTVAPGDALVTIEAMKMQNEIRAPRSGTVTAVDVEPGQTIAGGALLVRLAKPDP